MIPLELGLKPENRLKYWKDGIYFIFLEKYQFDSFSPDRMIHNKNGFQICKKSDIYFRFNFQLNWFSGFIFSTCMDLNKNSSDTTKIFDYLFIYPLHELELMHLHMLRTLPDQLSNKQIIYLFLYACITFCYYHANIPPY